MVPSDQDKSHARRNPRGRSRAAESIHRRLVGLVRSLLTQKGEDILAGLPEKIELQLRLPVRLDRDEISDSKKFAQSLLAQVDSLRIQGETEALGHRSGHAPCYWCNAAVCEHSSPPDHHSVLIGWSPTGVPIWKNLTSVLIDTKDDQIDNLYGENPGPAIRWISEGDLLNNILPEYLNDSLFARPVGALIAGGFTLAMPHGDTELLSITALILESRIGRSVPKYSLNLISSPPAPHHLATLLGSEHRSVLPKWISSLRSSIHNLQQELQSLAQKGNRSSLQTSRELVVDLLIESKSLLQTLRRRSRRRTKHAQIRAEDPSRPTSAAISDLLSCDHKDIFHDRKESTVVIRGRSGRIHIFTANGLHVTSAIFSNEAIQTRLIKGRWQPMEKGKGLAFLEHVSKKLSSAQDENNASDAS